MNVNSRNRKNSIIIGFTLALLFAVTLAIFVVARTPNSTANGSVDSGVTACKNIAENAKLPADKKKDVTRVDFEKSKHADLMAAGTGLVDAIHKVSDIESKPTPESTTLEQAGQELGTQMGATLLLNTQYGLLKTACSSYGVELPASLT